MTNKPELTDERISYLIDVYAGTTVHPALVELQQRRLADKNCFMYGIADPDGKPYLDEFCVSSDQGLMEDEASALNDTFETDGYRAVALYTALPLTDSERTELQERRKDDSVKINDDMAYAFHHALSDSSLGADEVEEIKKGLQAAFANVAAPQPALKDHQIRELVNELRDIAVKYHGTQQLRERIAHTVRAAMLNERGIEWVGFDPAKESAASWPECNCWRCQMVKILSGHGEVEK